MRFRVDIRFLVSRSVATIGEARKMTLPTVVSQGLPLGFMQRKIIPELLDEDLGTPAEVASSLEDLRHINQRFGGRRTTTTLLRRVAAECHSRRLSMLEVAAGSGDLPLDARRGLAGEGIDLDVTLLDRMWSHLPGERVAAVCGDALKLPFRDSAFDVVSCSLFAHHLSPEALRAFVREGLRVCRHAVLINDLIRSRLHLWLVYAGLPLFRSRITRHDAPASVRNAYTVSEMRQALDGMPARRIAISRHYLYRMGVLLWKGGNQGDSD
jgi:SAM-dependent methyltransferase